MKKFWAVFVARNLEFFRDRSTLIFNLVFPIVLIFGFAYAFPAGGGTSFKIGLVGDPPAVGSPTDIAFLHYKHIQFVRYSELGPPLDRLAHNQLDMVLDFSKSEYYINEASSNGYILERMLAPANESAQVASASAQAASPPQTAPHPAFTKHTVSGTPIRYVDWFVPGIIGINILLGSLSGVGFVIVRYRRNGVLKRFKATPLSAFEFVSAQVLSRFFIVAFLSVAIFAGTDAVLHFRMAGSWGLLFLVNALAILCMIALGLVFSSRIKSEEVAGGIMNLITWPMMILSGVFFSLEGTPRAMQIASRAFPITYYIESSRAIMLDGAGFAQIAGDLGVLAAMTLVFLAAAAALFRWE
ncbi:MAG TPA: ABC transporter permease [Rectinemataceae bacterium]|nr:ABC transporter permease [Rectinemataceae bacterium]